ncbi:hypothetical protein D3C71_1217620 [compost metagenome]
MLRTWSLISRSRRFLIHPTSTKANTAHNTPAPTTSAIIFTLLRHRASQAYESLAIKVTSPNWRQPSLTAWLAGCVSSGASF